MFAVGTSSAEKLSQCCHARAMRLTAVASPQGVANVRIYPRATSPRTLTDVAKAPRRLLDRVAVENCRFCGRSVTPPAVSNL